MRKQEPAAGKPVAILPGIVTELDRAIFARSDAGDTRRAICEAFGVKLGRVYDAESVCLRDAHGRKLLAERADSIEGLSYIGELDGKAADRLHYHHFHHDCHPLIGLGEVAALGRAYVSRMKGIGPKSLASIDRALGLLGIAWSPIERTPQPKPHQPQEQERDQRAERNQFWSDIVRRVADIECAMGTGVLCDAPGRDSLEGISFRLAFLAGYLDAREKVRERTDSMRDITPEPDDQDDGDYETAGNLICLPGVKLADVQPNDGDRA
jgi:hypothetical protein